MARVQTLVQLTDEIVELLDREAARTGRSRSGVIRDAIDAYLAAGRERVRTAQLVEGYSRIPQGASDEWGDVTELVRKARERTLRRLDDEEEAAGVKW